MRSKWFSVLAVVVMAAFCVSAFAESSRDVPAPGPVQFVQLGTISSGGGAAVGGGDIVYDAFGIYGLANQGYFPTATQADDLVITEPGAVGQNILYYTVLVGGYADAASCPGATPAGFDVTVGLWTRTIGTEPANPANTMGFLTLRSNMPKEPIPGTECSFSGVPKAVGGSIVQLQCIITGNVPLPQLMYLVVDTDDPGGQCAGPITTGVPPTNGSSTGRWRAPIGCNTVPCAPTDECASYGPPPLYMGVYTDFAPPIPFPGQGLGPVCHYPFPGPTSQSDYYSIGYANPTAGNFNLQIVVEGQPWACCDTTTFDCTNVQESDCAGVWTDGTLCNNLTEPCSAAGACCDTALGVCRDTFESLCAGYLEVFTAGSTCSTVSCPVPPNVPTLTQWGMVTLTVLLLTGLTIKFGRRHTVTA